MNLRPGEGRLGAPVGGSDVASGWRIFFWAACIFNFVVGLLGMLSPEATVDARIIGLFVFSFGVVFLLIAREPRRYGAMLWAGVIGKIGVVGLLGPAAFGQDGNTFVAVALAVDGIFALGFLAFLFMRNEEGWT